jgi:hypothetical protein
MFLFCQRNVSLGYRYRFCVLATVVELADLRAQSHQIGIDTLRFGLG